MEKYRVGLGGILTGRTGEFEWGIYAAPPASHVAARQLRRIKPPAATFLMDLPMRGERLSPTATECERQVACTLTDIAASGIAASGGPKGGADPSYP